ncbi:hypothetical protein ACFTWD_22380 [Streptomyces sp. NPDC056943]|uniref:hypothetical protein n=1 Tax=Streptomyces sp. NPDC056943 TaxID=3345971 RepID=UPI0036393C7C
MDDLALRAAAAAGVRKKATALAAGAVAAGALVLGGWFGYQHLEQQVGSGEVLRGYDAYTPAGTAPHSENVFTGRVAAFEERRDIDHWTTDIYRVDVVSVLMYQGEMRPVDDGQLAVWRDAVALPMAPQESSSGP